MKIETERPPNFERIVSVFPLADRPGVIFAYGDTIYNPSAVGIPNALRAHEELHGKRQRKAGVEAWWQAYLTDASFRYIEELKAHIAEMDTRRRGQSVTRNDWARIHMQTAQRLISPLYNYGIAQPTLQQALNNIASELARPERYKLRVVDNCE